MAKAVVHMLKAKTKLWQLVVMAVWEVMGKCLGVLADMEQ